MSIADFIAAHKGRVISKWEGLAVERLALDLETSELLNDLPDFLEDMIDALRDPSQQWPALESARSHGRHRMRSGIDIGALTEEIALVIEAVCVVAEEEGRSLTTTEVVRLSRIIGRGTAASVNAYAAMRDQQLAKQAREHFSFIAHELRTPLQTARMAATVLGSASDAKREEVERRLDRSLAQVSELVDNALVQVRLSGEPDVHFERHRVRDLVDIAHDDIIDHADARSLSLVIDVDDFELDADRKLLVSALTNLLKNAVKFTCDAGTVTLRVCEREDRALFEIEDECGGLPEDLPPRLFQPYVQANADQSGFGLGLMIVKQAAEAHGGSVRVNNRPPEGCTFVIDIPLRHE